MNTLFTRLAMQAKDLPTLTKPIECSPWLNSAINQAQSIEPSPFDITQNQAMQPTVKQHLLVNDRKIQEIKDNHLPADVSKQIASTQKTSPTTSIVRPMSKTSFNDSHESDWQRNAKEEKISAEKSPAIFTQNKAELHNLMTNQQTRQPATITSANRDPKEQIIMKPPPLSIIKQPHPLSQSSQSNPTLSNNTLRIQIGHVRVRNKPAMTKTNPHKQSSSASIRHKVSLIDYLKKYGGDY